MTDPKDIVLGILYTLGLVGALTGIWVFTSTGYGMEIGADVPGLFVVAGLVVVIFVIVGGGLLALRLTDDESSGEAGNEGEQTNTNTPDHDRQQRDDNDTQSTASDDSGDREFSGGTSTGNDDALSHQERQEGLVGDDGPRPNTPSSGGGSGNEDSAGVGTDCPSAPAVPSDETDGRTTAVSNAPTSDESGESQQDRSASDQRRNDGFGADHACGIDDGRAGDEDDSKGFGADRDVAVDPASDAGN
jgi:hypothetical protein